MATHNGKRGRHLAVRTGNKPAVCRFGPGRYTSARSCSLWRAGNGTRPTTMHLLQQQHASTCMPSAPPCQGKIPPITHPPSAASSHSHDDTMAEPIAQTGHQHRCGQAGARRRAPGASIPRPKMGADHPTKRDHVGAKASKKPPAPRHGLAPLTLEPVSEADWAFGKPPPYPGLRPNEKRKVFEQPGKKNEQSSTRRLGQTGNGEERVSQPGNMWAARRSHGRKKRQRKVTTE